MILGYAQVSTDGQNVAAQAAKIFRATASRAKTDRTQLRKATGTLDPGDMLLVMRLDRLARSTRDLLNTLAAIADRKAGFRSLGEQEASGRSRYAHAGATRRPDFA